MRTKTPRAALAVALLLTLAAACRPGGDGTVEVGEFRDAPIVVISIDTLRSDHLPAYGYDQVETPALDALRRDAILYERAYSHTPLTFPSHVSMLTGLLPTVHEVRDNVGYRYDAARFPGLPLVLRKAGYATGGAVSAYVLRADTGMSQGFDAYDDGVHVRFTDSLGLSQRAGGETVASALTWVRTVADKPFFLFLHLYEPHTPYAPPEPFAARYAGRPYDGEIAAADAIVGRFLDELKGLGVYDRAIVVLTSDHGEGLEDHGEKEHGIFLYREAIQVPLMLKLPESRRGGKSVAAPAQLVDIFPTLLSLVGVEPPPLPAGVGGAGARPGRSLLGLEAGDGAAPREIYAETFYPRLHFGWSELTSLVRDRFHYIESPEPELYDLAADPRETKNVLAGERRAYASLRQAMEEVARELKPPSAVDPETARKLAALGYAGGTAQVSAGQALPAPRGRIHTLKDFEQAMGAFGQKRYAEAVPAFERLLASNPSMVDAWENLGQSLQKLGRLEEALTAYERALETSGGAAHLAVATGSLLLEMGRLDDAQAHAELGLAVTPSLAHSLLAQVALARDRPEEAEKAARAAVAAPGAKIGPLMTLATVLQKRGRLEEALKTTDDAVAELTRTGMAGQKFPGLQFVRGDLLARLGRTAEAERAFSEEIQGFPADTRPYASLALLYASEGRPQEAVGVLRRMVEGNGSPAAYVEAVKTLRILGDSRGAAALLRHALAVHPDSRELRTLTGT